MKKGKIIRFTVDREHYQLKPLKPEHCIFLVGKVLYSNGRKIRTKFLDIWGDSNEHTITIERSQIVEVV